ncbi:hypothetical protein D3C76_992650 [compost metagenome]
MPTRLRASPAVCSTAVRRVACWLVVVSTAEIRAAWLVLLVSSAVARVATAAVACCAAVIELANSPSLAFNCSSVLAWVAVTSSSRRMPACS